MELPILGLPHLGEHFPTFLATQPVYLLPIPGFRSLHQVIDIRLTRSVANIFQLDALFPACGSIPRIERLLRPENGKKEAPVIRVLWTTWTLDKPSRQSPADPRRQRGHLGMSLDTQNSRAPSRPRAETSRIVAQKRISPPICRLRAGTRTSRKRKTAGKLVKIHRSTARHLAAFYPALLIGRPSAVTTAGPGGREADGNGTG